MPRTGRRAQALLVLLERAGLRSASSAPRRPDGAAQADELLQLYRRLGGLQDRPVLQPGAWDLIFAGGLVVELDEELHFNRWRAATLGTSWSAGLPWAEVYRRQCIDHEPDCLRAGQWGRRWTNPSAARMFSGGPPGDLNGAGAPRWKQRALYDSVKDTAPTACPGVTLARVSVWDTVGDVTLGDVLDGRPVDPAEVLILVERRRASARQAQRGTER